MKRPGIIAVSIALTFLSENALAAGGWGYAPLGLERLSHVLPQRCIQTSEDKGKPIDVDGVQVIYKDSLVLSSATKDGKKWSLKLCPVADEYEIWQADFDRNGEPDLAILTPTGGTGFACSTRVLFIMFDKAKTPRISAGFSTGLNSEKPKPKINKGGERAAPNAVPGIQDICRSDSGEAIVVLQSVEHSKGHSYWRTSAWRAKDCRFKEIHEIYGARLPSYVLFTNKENHKPSLGKDYLGENAASGIFDIFESSELEEGEEFTIK